MIPLLLGMSVGCAKAAATSPADVAQDSLNSSQVHFRNENRSISTTYLRKEQRIGRRRLATCPTTIYKVGDTQVAGTDGWNEWSESCLMGNTHAVGSTETVKIKKSSSMSGELVIDREATSGLSNRHFDVRGTLELEDITLKGGHAVSSFVSLYCSFFDGDNL